jgi:Cu(I)/Ag(I) efflux system periplasmic protein CusF
MKRFAVVLFAALATMPALAQMKGMDMKDGDMKGMDMKSEKKAGKAAVHNATGVVTKVDHAASKVTIKHGPVQSLSWPSMTMAFTVKDKAMLDKIKKDQKVDFEFVQQGKDYVVTSVK